MKQWTAAEMGRKGGKRRAEVLTSARQAEIATLANRARWKGLTLSQRREQTAAARAAWVKKAARKAKS